MIDIFVDNYKNCQTEPLEICEQQQVNIPFRFISEREGLVYVHTIQWSLTTIAGEVINGREFATLEGDQEIVLKYADTNRTVHGNKLVQVNLACLLTIDGDIIQVNSIIPVVLQAVTVLFPDLSLIEINRTTTDYLNSEFDPLAEADPLEELINA